MNNILRKLSAVLLFFISMSVLTSCDDSTSYADLLNDENKAVNVFLADQRVINEIPSDSVFEYGEDAPFYRLDEDGNIYMQVIKPGDRDNKVTDDQLIYFRFIRYNLNYYADGQLPEGTGNANDFDYINTSFRFANYSLNSSSKWGSGIQMPLYYLGIDCEVNLVIKSQYGFTDEISSVIPYLFNVRYFKSQI